TNRSFDSVIRTPEQRHIRGSSTQALAQTAEGALSPRTLLGACWDGKQSSWPHFRFRFAPATRRKLLDDELSVNA
ncbi:MAG: hypothetical protein Q8R98_02860, partial [Rubrivivax sp.]|nr:hypothetical protein [Rubrivivax sp.]